VNGVLLPEVSTDAIVAAIRKCLDSPDLLAQMSAAALARDSFSLEMLADKLLK
jgi:glycosyltransferase involved in cell wall biosynthesis